MTKKQQRYKRWIRGTINMIAAAKHIGYEQNLHEGVKRVRRILSNMKTQY